MSDTDSPAPPAPIAVWPPQPLRPPPPVPVPAAVKRRWATLTPHVWLDILLGLPAGLVGALLLTSLVVGLATPLDSAQVDPVPLYAGFCGSILLGLAACAVLLLRRTVFGGAATVGTVILWGSRPCSSGCNEQ